MPDTVLSPTALAQPEPGVSFLSLCYHDVRDSDTDQAYVGVSTNKLIEQFNWFKDNDYNPVSVDDILAAQNGGKPLPKNAILLTFDDGYVSFYTRVFPLLKSFNYPAVFALVNSWMDEGGHVGDSFVDYGGIRMPAKAFLNWNQVREMAQSGLIEIASHTSAMHRGINANPQGNTEPMVVTRRYDQTAHGYESHDEYVKRLDDDFAAAAKKINHETGRAPRVMVWPYGKYNQLAIDIAAAHGMPITMTLDDGFGTANNLTAIPRYLINADPDLQEFVLQMRTLSEPSPVRAAHVDLDYLYSSDPQKELKNLDTLIARIYTMKINTVFLKAYSDPQETGVAREVYFPNRHLPMRRDLFNRVAWQLSTRTHVKIYGVLPVLAFDFGVAPVSPVLAWNPKTGQTARDVKLPPRISPFDPLGRRMIQEVYEDMAGAGAVTGVQFLEDATLSEYEDASIPALAAYAAAGLPPSVAEIRANDLLVKKWADLKTNSLIAFTKGLTASVRKYRAPITTARRLYAPVLLDPANEARYAQRFKSFQQTYDYTAIMAMPLVENISLDDADPWIKKLINTAATYPQGLRRTIFTLQTVDWNQPKNNKNRFIPVQTIAAQMRLLARSGAMNFSYTPDNYITDQPKEADLHGDFSLQSYPYRP